MWNIHHLHNKVSNETIKGDVADKALTAILTDSEDGLNEVFKTVSSPNLSFSYEKYKLPSILGNELPLISLAAYFGATNCVNYLMSLDPDLDLVDTNGRYVHHFAAAGGRIDVIRALEKDQDSVNCVDSNGWRPFDYAVEYGHIDLVRYFWSKDRIPTDSHYNKPIPIQIACFQGHLNIVKFLYQNTKTDKDVLQRFYFTGMNCLHYACKGGHVDIVAYLLEKGLDVNLQSEEKKSPIIYASQSGSIKVVKKLLEYGPKIKYKNRVFNPLVSASAEGHLDIVKFFVEQGVSVDVFTSDGMTPLKAAIEKGRMSVVHYLLNHGATLDNNVDSPLLIACESGKVDLIKLFIRLEKETLSSLENIDLINGVVSIGDLSLIQCLIENGVDFAKIKPSPFKVQQTDFFSRNETRSDSFFSILISNNNFDLLKFFVEDLKALNRVTDHEDCPAVQFAFFHNQYKLAKYLIDNGALFSKEIVENYDLVTISVNRNSLQLLELALSVKPDLNQVKTIDLDQPKRYNRGFNVSIFFPLLGVIQSRNIQYHTFEREGEIEIIKAVRLLIENGALINPPSEEGQMYLLHATMQLGDLEVFKEIYNNGGAFDTLFKPFSFINRHISREKSADYSSPIIFGYYRKDHIPIFEFLLSQKFNVNCVDIHGNNLLHDIIASQNPEMDLIKIFIDKGVDINHKNILGRTPLMIAADKAKFAILPKLLYYGADPNLKDIDGFTALMFSAKSPDSLFGMYSLIENGADVNTVSNSNETAFIISLKSDPDLFNTRHGSFGFGFNSRNNIDFLKSRGIISHFLIDHGADIRNYPGGVTSLLNKAKETGHIPLIRTIEKKLKR